ncbi:MAG TPA: hypothetical protein VLN45_00370 [Ignavibacteriaceae bacterium]|nr:hypothetical protein [Ignavibacteriaceae bacterium]
MSKINFPSILFLIIFSLSESFTQNEILFSSELYKIILTDKLLSVRNNNENEIFTKEFLKPEVHSLDLDGDGIDEFLIKDIIELDSSKEYFLYIYNLLDTFYLSAEINSGVVEPYETFSEEIEGLIVVSGNTDFSFLNIGSEIKSLPINSWKFEDGELFLVNEELYDIFMTENDNHLSIIYSRDINDCDKSVQAKSLLASIYINYLNAGEIATAENVLKTLYLCDDVETFKSELNNIFNKENNETELE